VRVVLKAPGKPGGGYYPPPSGKPGGGYYPPPGAAGPPPGMMMYPPGSVPPPPLMKRRSTGLFVTGIVLIPVGAITALVGGVMVAAADSTSFDFSDSDFGRSSSSSSGSGAGVGVLAVGGLMLVGGIVMTVIGGKKVPVDPGAALLLDPRHSPPAPKASVTPLFGPVSGVRVQF